MQTTYQKNHEAFTKNGRKGKEYQVDHELYILNKTKNQMTNTLPADHPMHNKTEYQREYIALRSKSYVCPVYKMPSIPQELKKNHDHIEYHKSVNNWIAKDYY